MKKKLLIVIAVVALAAIVKNIITTPDPPSESGGPWTDNKISASYPSGVINEAAIEPIHQLVYVDVTGSMTPYYVKDKRTNVVNAMSAVLTLIPRDSIHVRFLGGNEVHTGFGNDILQKAYDKKDIKDDKKKLSRVTNFDMMFKMAVDSVLNKPGTVVYLITDGIQSLNKRSYSMADYLNELRGSIKSSLSNASDIACGIFRYLGDFNGTFINCREISMDNQHLQRPFYIIAFGDKSRIRWLANQNDEKLGSPQGKLFIGTHDFLGHKKAVLSKPDSTHLEKMGEDVTLILNLPPCMVKEINPSECQITGVANPSIVTKNITPEGLEIKIPSACGIHSDPSGFVSIGVSMPNKIGGEWLTTWSTNDDTLGPDSISTFGLSSLVMGIVDGLQPDPVYFQTTFRYIP